MEEIILTVEELNIKEKEKGAELVRSLSFTVKAGEIVGIAGESGSGKTMTALSIMGLLPKDIVCQAKEFSFRGKTDSSKERFVVEKEKEQRLRTDAAIRVYKKTTEQIEKENLLEKTEKEYEVLRGNQIAMIFQEPMTSLNPVLRVGKQVEEVLLLHSKASQEERKQKALEAMQEAGLNNPEMFYERYPHELSGGQRQRMMIAMAMLGKPKLLIADEPTTALDAQTEEQILALLKRLSQTHHMAVLFISHNLYAVRKLCERVLILKDGVLVEEGLTEQIFKNPKADYTKKLLQSMPTGKKEQINGREGAKKLLSVERLNVYYTDKKGLFGKPVKHQVIFDTSFSIQEGEIVGLVGESGNGKTTLIKTIAGFHKDYDGTITKTGVQMQMVFQDPYSSLNPAKKIGWILEEPLRLNTKLGAKERKKQVLQMLSEVELPDDCYDRYVRELSGGQRQRVAIAVALIQKPKLILLDEPVSALDVTIQAQILDLLLRLQKEYHLTYLFISHDKNVIEAMCDRILFMKEGRITE